MGFSRTDTKVGSGDNRMAVLDPLMHAGKKGSLQQRLATECGKIFSQGDALQAKAHKSSLFLKARFWACCGVCVCTKTSQDPNKLLSNYSTRRRNINTNLSDHPKPPNASSIIQANDFQTGG